MNFFKKQKQRIFVYSGLILAIFSFVVYTIASDTSGTIDSDIKYAWSENAGWINFGDENGDVEVTDLELRGYSWSENLGWISLNCSDNDKCAISSYKVSNDAEGNLSGYAWSENAGWINFAPSNGGVHIDSSGEFSGYAWGENIGWVVFSCDDLDSCGTSNFRVKTDWRPLSYRTDEENEDFKLHDVIYSSTDASITIKWKTNQEADSHVRWGTDKNLEEEKNEDRKEKSHQIILRNLEPDTKYYFRVKSTNENDYSESSKIYTISTKPASKFFASRPYLDKSKYEKPKETLKVDVSDEKEAPSEVGLPETAEEQKITEKEGTNFLWISSISSGISNFFSNAYAVLKNTAENIAFAVKNSFISTQKGIQKLADSFRNRKEIEVPKMDENGGLAMEKIERYYSTQVFKKDDVKRIAEVKFQLLDKKEKPIVGTETMLFSDPQTSITNEFGIASFNDVPVGKHTLAFAYEGKEIKKKIAIGDTVTEEGLIRAEIFQIRAEKEKIAVWMWIVIILLIGAVGTVVYLAVKYRQLKILNNKENKV